MWRPEVNVSVFLDHSPPLLIETGALNQTQGSLTWLELLPSLLWESLFPISKEAGVTGRLSQPPDVYLGFRDLNAGP